MTNASHLFGTEAQLTFVRLHQMELSEAWRQANAGRHSRGDHAPSPVRLALAGAAFRVGMVSFRLSRALRGPEAA